VRLLVLAFELDLLLVRVVQQLLLELPDRRFVVRVADDAIDMAGHVATRHGDCIGLVP
jgi:hypothetical protein